MQWAATYCFCRIRYLSQKRQNKNKQCAGSCEMLRWDFFVNCLDLMLSCNDTYICNINIMEHLSHYQVWEYPYKILTNIISCSNVNIKIKCQYYKVLLINVLRNGKFLFHKIRNFLFTIKTWIYHICRMQESGSDVQIITNFWNNQG